MSDKARADLDQRLRCVRGHLAATARMIEGSTDDLAVVHQLQAVHGALAQIQVRLLHVWLAEHADWLQQPDQIQQVERDLREILKRRRQHGCHSRL